MENVMRPTAFLSAGLAFAAGAAFANPIDVVIASLLLSTYRTYHKDGPQSLKAGTTEHFATFVDGTVVDWFHHGAKCRRQ